MFGCIHCMHHAACYCRGHTTGRPLPAYLAAITTLRSASGRKFSDGTQQRAHTRARTHTSVESCGCERMVHEKGTQNEKGHHGFSITSMPWRRRKLYYPYALRAPRAANSFSVCSFTALLNISYTCRQPFTASRRTACGRRTTCYNAAGGIAATPMPACTSYTSSGSLESICTSVTLFVLGSSATGSCGPPPFFSR